jgi:hypothetical protein
MYYLNQRVIKYDENLKEELRIKYNDKINCIDATEDGINEEYFKDVDIHGMTDNHTSPLFESDPEEDQLQLNSKEVAVDGSDYNGLNLAQHCPDSCFSGKEDCDNKKVYVQLINLGNHVLFPTI